MTKSDLAARPIFHRLRDSIEAHLTIVFAALAVSREAQARTGLSINKIVKTLRSLRSATITELFPTCWSVRRGSACDPHE